VGRGGEPGCFEHAIAAARDGRAAGFDHVFRTLGPRVAGYLRAQGASDPDGSTNEVFLRVFSQLERFEGDESAFRAWVFAIARCRLIDDRRAAARRLAGEALVARHAEIVGGDVVADAEVGLGTAWVESVLDQLEPDQRDVLVLRIVGALSLPEIASILGKSLGAVKALQRRGLAAVRRTLELSDEEISQLAVPF
jgi:RNA polymerase sigma-70 factor, ECF subfamily